MCPCLIYTIYKMQHVSLSNLHWPALVWITLQKVSTHLHDLDSITGVKRNIFPDDHEQSVTRQWLSLHQNIWQSSLKVRLQQAIHVASILLMAISLNDYHNNYNGGSRISQTVAPTPKGTPTYYLTNCSPKTVWNWKK